MELKNLGYTNKWLTYGVLDKGVFIQQFKEFQKGEDQNTEHYRYSTFMNWLKQKDVLTDIEIENFIELASEDPDKIMSGSAVKVLFTSPQITTKQYNLIKEKLSSFGDWTIKLIKREDLKKKIENTDLSDEIIKESINYSRDFNENILIELIIKKSNNVEIIAEFTNINYTRKIRNLANEKLKKFKKSR